MSRKICTYFFLDTNTDAERREDLKNWNPFWKMKKKEKKRKKRNDGRRWKKIPGKKKGIRKTKEKKETTKAIRTTLEATKERKRKKEKKIKRKKEKRIKERKERKKEKKKRKEKKKKKKKKVYSTRYSQAVTHPSTNLARRCLTSVIGREPVFSTWYGRRHYTLSNKLTYIQKWVKNAYTNSIITSACTPHLFLLA